MPTRRIGIVGSLVWDQIHGRDPARGPVEEWGGIAYTLSGFEASLGSDWEIVPLIKVGRDLIQEADRFLGTLEHRHPAARFLEVPTPNNRVVLRYQSTERRCERMAGGVPGWTWAELGPLVRDLDALYVNFISGLEILYRMVEEAGAGPVTPGFLRLGHREAGFRQLELGDRLAERQHRGQSVWRGPVGAAGIDQQALGRRPRP